MFQYSMLKSNDIPHSLILALNTLNLVAIHYQVSSREIYTNLGLIEAALSSQILGAVPALTDVLSRTTLISQYILLIQ